MGFFIGKIWIALILIANVIFWASYSVNKNKDKNDDGK